MMNEVNHRVSTSKESCCDEERVCMEGIISKWTNYYHGWQDRYVCCKDGTLFYYRTRDETEYGCRGSISLSKACVTSHEFDPCRFDVHINDNTWYLRTSDASERQQWIDTIESNRSDSDDVSLQSDMSVSTRSSHQLGCDYQEKLSEIDIFRGILSKQIETLQQYFDAYTLLPRAFALLKGNNGTPVDPNVPSVDEIPDLDAFNFKAEAMTFRATTTEMQSAIHDCVALMQDREEMWQKKCENLEKSLIEEKKRSQAFASASAPSTSISGAGNWLEDDDSDDEFHDPNNNFDRKFSHRFSEELEAKMEENLRESFTSPDCGSWELLTQDGDTRLYRRELVRDGIVCDPIKALLSANRVTARELCHYFWETNERMSWDFTIEQLRAVETIDESTAVVHQIHKQVWPIVQRDCLYMSANLKVTPRSNNGCQPHDTWVVCNFSVDHSNAPLPPERIRAIVEVSLVCQTFVTPPPDGGAITRDCLKCDIVYIANVNPGGWAPASILRAIGKREYPRFLKNFITFVQKKCENNEIWF